jgi:hypothetical protein
VRELELLQSYLTRLRQEKLQGGHAAALAATNPDDMMHLVARAHEAELVSRILAAVKDLDKDMGLFIKNHLSQP